MDTWPVVLLGAALMMLFRWQGDSCPVTLTTLLDLGMLVLTAAAVLGGLIVRLW